MTPAEELREAAGQMRERALGCETRRWYWEALGEKRYPQRVSSEGNVALIAETYIDPSHRPYEAEHIAGMNPLVGLAVADLLDAAARVVDGAPASEVDGMPLACRTAVYAARAYLGSKREAAT